MQSILTTQFEKGVDQDFTYFSMMSAMARNLEGSDTCLERDIGATEDGELQVNVIAAIFGGG